ncbi:MAG: AraC family transcriptional regulator [bacterium]|nr:AraC family transcriptional regulator [bacterium]
MYNPVQKGIDRSARAVRYTETKPPEDLSEYVHRFWEIKTEAKLSDDFIFHILPDACIHIVFNLAAPGAAGITALRTSAEELNLGQSFHFVGIRLLPGVWQGHQEELVQGVIDAPYPGPLPLIEAGGELAAGDTAAVQSVLSKLVRRLIKDDLLAIDEVTTHLLANIDEIDSVSDMANAVGMSPRQLQRVLKQTTGFSPHDLLKILRLQKSFVRDYLEFYADQSHYIHSFRKIAGYTPKNYARKFDV